MEPSPTVLPEVSLPLRCRPDQSNWVFIILFGIFGVMSMFFPAIDAHSEHPSSDPLMVWILALLGAIVFFLPALLGAVWLCRAYIRAEENGLRWRGLGRWRYAPWSEVTDYYERLPQKRSSPVSAIIETAAGRLKFDNSWRKSDALRTALVGHAVKARAKEWGVFGTRLGDDWPRVFDYEAHKIRCVQIVFGVMVAVMITLPWWSVLSRLARDYGTAAFSWDLAGAGVGSLAMTAQFGLMYYIGFRQSQASLRRADQRLVADLSSLTQYGKDQTVRLDWEEVTDYFFAGTGHISDMRRYVVVTKRDRIEFLPSLRDSGLLAKIVSLFAIHAEAKEWRRRESDVLGGAASRRSGGCEGIGERIFGYRTRTNRAFLWFPLFITILPVICYGLDACLGLPAMPCADFPWTLYVSSVILLIWAYWRYRSARIQVDANGLTQYTLLGKRFLAWQDIQRFTKNDGDILTFYSVAGVSGPHIWFWLGIADLEELKAEIERRATHCQGQAWKKKERPPVTVNP